MTYEELINECRRLRLAHEQGEARFFVFLMEAESKHREVWSAFGHATFDTFLRSNHLVDTDRYAAFVRGVEKSSVSQAMSVGAPATIQLGRIRSANPDVSAEFIRRAEAFVSTENVVPSDQTAALWRRHLDAPEQEHRTIRKASELDRLRGENHRLKLELATAHKRIAELEGLLTGAPTAEAKRKRKRDEAVV